MLRHSPAVDRVESQLLLFDAGEFAELVRRPRIRDLSAPVPGVDSAAADGSSARGGCGYRRASRRIWSCRMVATGLPGRGRADLRLLYRPRRLPDQRPVPHRCMARCDFCTTLFAFQDAASLKRTSPGCCGTGEPARWSVWCCARACQPKSRTSHNSASRPRTRSRTGPACSIAARTGCCAGFEAVTLTVTERIAAVSLYERFGFHAEASLRRDGAGYGVKCIAMIQDEGAATAVLRLRLRRNPYPLRMTFVVLQLFSGSAV